jgi:hypothetical protein
VAPGTYGEARVELLADAVGYKPSVVYRHARVAKQWPRREDIEALCVELGPYGRSLSWSHLEILAPLDECRLWANIALLEGWSIRVMNRQLEAAGLKRRMLKQATASEAWLQDAAALTESVRGAITDPNRCSDDEITDTTPAAVKLLVKSIKRIVDQFLAREFTPVEERLRRGEGLDPRVAELMPDARTAFHTAARLLTDAGDSIYRLGVRATDAALSRLPSGGPKKAAALPPAPAPAVRQLQNTSLAHR